MSMNAKSDFSSTIDDGEFDGEIKAATRNKLAKEFGEFASNKRSARMLLSQFAELIA